MKICPACRSVYDDDTQKFCTRDGKAIMPWSLGLTVCATCQTALTSLSDFFCGHCGADLRNANTILQKGDVAQPVTPTMGV